MYDTAESWLPNMIQSGDIEFTLSTFNTLQELEDLSSMTTFINVVYR